MTSSILTNTSAMTALRVLSSINKDLTTTQNRISTGLKVANAKDNASFWAVSTIMKSDVSTFKAISDNLSLAMNSTSVARTGAEGISDLLTEIKEKATAAQEGSIDKDKLQADIDSALDGIAEYVKSAQFNGVNLLSESKELKLLSSVGRAGAEVDASYIKLRTTDLSMDQGGALSDMRGFSVLDRGDGILEKSTDASTRFTFDATNVDSSAADQGQAGDVITVAYVDEDGVARSVDVTLSKDLNQYSTAAAGDFGVDFAAALSENERLADLFTFEGNGTDLNVANKDRESGIQLTSITVGGGTVFGPGTAGGEGNAADVQQEIEFNFKDEPLRLGETFKFDFSAQDAAAADANFQMVFKVVGGERTSGDVLDSRTLDDGTKQLTVAIDERMVTRAFTTGEDIRDEFFNALDAIGSGTFTAGTVEADFVAALDPNAAGQANQVNYSKGTAPETLFLRVDNGNNTQLTNFQVPQTDYDALLDTVESALQTAIDTAAAFGSAQKRLEIQQEFLGALIDNLETGIGTLVDADMNEESARLQALQVQQQLGVQALGIANSAPQALLQLFQ